MKLAIVIAAVALAGLTACNPLDPPVQFQQAPATVNDVEADVPPSEPANELPGVEAGNENPCIPRDEFGGNCANGEPCTPRDEWDGACLPPTPTTAAPSCIPRDEFGGQCDPSLTDEELARGGGLK